MAFLNKFLTRILLIMFAILLFVLAPQVSYAIPVKPIQDNIMTIIDKDSKSGAVIFKKKGAYFYGISRTNQIVNQGEIIPKEIIVKFKDKKNNNVKMLESDSITEITSLSLAEEQSDNYPKLTLVKFAKENEYFRTLKTLKKNPDVVYAEPNYVVKAQMVPNDPYYSQQWGPQMINAQTAWDKISPEKRSRVTIALLDSGINGIHEDLQNNIIPGYDFVDNDNDPNDSLGHGTHVAGIAAAIINNKKGIAGIAGGSKIMPLKVLDDSGSGSIANIITGIKYAADHGANVISMSLGCPGTSSAMQDAVNYALNHGVSVVAAAGNNNSPVTMPGNCDGVITVSALDSTGNRAFYSNFGPEMDVAAPGSDILSTYNGNSSSYTSLSGTSMAAPAVAGVVALVRAANPNLSPAAVTDIIRQSAVDKGNPGFDHYYGYGLADANRAVDLALKGSIVPVPSPGETPTPSPRPSPKPVPVPTPSPVPIPVPTPPTAPITPPSPITSSNLALHKFAMASSVEGRTRTTAQAVDGNTQTRWASAPGQDPQWIYVDLGEMHTIKKIVLKWETAYAKSYLIQVSNDGLNWVTVYKTNTGVGGTTNLVGSVNGRFVRMYGIKRGTVYGYSLWEFGVYGS